ncbi:YbhB/YbcL family Raf kinase inhibitor-like protein [Jannaschia donghaensis]|uniref:Putative kinase inhibitor protein n=1 Tax=Jannaschia donghaensis TaxID=420998 RepID=A0A0M6YDW6_9RHOB|nr:YbhB/YbcL family Raf kinase inhibitor-like protein [Jannaschia donghaensis]CTQ48541.1 putative kinase inhibitor protein [Jannaschia donghaensis]
MIPASALRVTSLLSLTVVLTVTATAQEEFTLTSPVVTDGGALPADLGCAREGGDGLSPPLDWTNAPEDTRSFAVVMHHYPRGRIEGNDTPSHYWLLWNIPATITGLDRGNPASIGDEGADKDMRRTGYTPPCAPRGPLHEYTITIYALSAPPATLPAQDDGSVDWDRIIAAMDDLVLASSTLTFEN